MSKPNEKNEKSYIKIIDDTVTEDYLKYQNTSTIVIYVFLYLLFVMPIVGVVGALSNSVVVVFLTLIITIVAVVLIYQNGKKKRVDEWNKREKNKTTKQPIGKNKLSELKDLLTRIGYVSFSHCNGFVMSRSQMAKTQLVPLYGVATNPKVYEHRLIKVTCDLRFLSKKDRELIMEAFNCKKDDDIIWFSQKNVAKWTVASNVQAINFIDKNGNKMCFGHTRYSAFYNHRRLEIEDGECVIHITDKRQNNSEEPSINNQPEEQSEKEKEYYDEDI